MFVRRVEIAAAVFSLAFAAASASATAAGYSCRNGEFEIGCDKEKCKNADGFTPMQLTVDPDKKTVEICAYSGCWSGPLTVLGSDAKLVVGRADRLRSEGPQQSGPETIALIMDREQSAATVIGFGRIAPMSCTGE